MTAKRWMHILLRIGFLAALTTIAFWGVWSLFAPVPGTQQLWNKEKLIVELPISHWWYDPLFMFLFVNVVGWWGWSIAMAIDLCWRDRDAASPIGWFGFGLFIGAFFGVIGGVILAHYQPLFMLVYCPLLGTVLGVTGGTASGLVAMLVYRKFWSAVDRATGGVGRWLIAADK